MKGRWASGIEPRHFAWVVKGALAVSERPGGHARTHRRIRRQEEILWLKEQGFTRVVSLLPSPHNLHAYDELGVTWAHFPVGPAVELRTCLPEIYESLRSWLSAGERVLVHHEELGDLVLGVAAGYLLWSGKLTSGPAAVAVAEALVRRRIGPAGRAVVAEVGELPGAGVH
ncbi:MAG: hypothetical protein ACRDYD_07000 [Acidimicrobiales bacterium]